MAQDFPSISIHIPQLKCGDERAWTEVCDRFRIGLASKARQLVRGAGLHQKRFSADDLVQETLLKAWRHHNSFRGETTAQLAMWMLTVLRNTFLDKCRRKNLELSKETWQGVCGTTETPSAIVSVGEREAELLAALEELPHDQQNVIAMRIFEGMSFPQIAAATDSNINTIGSIYRRGLIRMTQLLRTSSSHSEFRVGVTSN